MSHQMRTLRVLWETEDKVTACRLEFWIKKLTRKQKLKLIENQDSIASVLPKTDEPLPKIKVIRGFDLSQVTTEQ